MIRVHQRLPRQVVRDAAQTLDLDVTGGTVVAPKLTVRIGSRVVVDNVDATSLSYSLLASAIDGEEPTDEWLEVWSGTIDGEPWSHGHTGHIVRYAFHGVADDSDLEAVHPDILSKLPEGETDTSKFRNLATQRIQRHLLKKGRRPWLIFDPWALLDAEVELSLHFYFADCARRFPQGAVQFRLDADRHERNYRTEIADVVFRYDEQRTGIIQDGDDQESAAGSPTVILSAGPRRSQRRFR